MIDHHARDQDFYCHRPRGKHTVLGGQARDASASLLPGHNSSATRRYAFDKGDLDIAGAAATEPCQGEAKIGITPTLARCVLAPALSRFVTQYPNVLVQVHEATVPP